MAHLMAHHGLDLGQRSFVEQIVIQTDARCAKQATDIGADALGLPRLIEPHDIGGGNVVGACQGQNRVPRFARRQRFVVIEQRRDEHRRDHEKNQQCDEGEHRCPQHPVLFGAPDEAIDGSDHNRDEYEIDDHRYNPVVQPSAEGLIRHVILMFAKEPRVPVHRQTEQRQDQP